MSKKNGISKKLIEPLDIRAAKIQFVSWIVLFISTALIQFADSRISNHQNLVNQKLLQSFNTLQIHLGEELKTQTSAFLQFIPFNNRSTEKIISNVVKDSKSNFLHSPEIDVAIDQLKNKEISLNDYFAIMLRIHKTKSGEHLNNYNKSIIEINRLMKKGTFWEPTKTYLLFPLQVLCVLYLGIVYFKALKDAIKNIKKG
jgi:hypothetical protein